MMTPHLVFTECLLLEKLLKEGQGEQTLNINMVYRRAMARILMLIIKAKMVMMVTISIHEDINANNDNIRSWNSNL